MRLLDTNNLKLTTFITKAPEYAILSHTWGVDEDEATFQELQPPSTDTHLKKGYIKIKRFCEVTRRNGYEWAWIDTCCIDKMSSAELSELINSIYK
ncbi:HET-domain-containing protein [Apiospora rasikravindrae]|uniref:HET-domain-containing protein n=1 Tax=Apiospora rasikravindrae TaxID=990691 RepID=A0ABR1SJF4_9PEZI